MRPGFRPFDAERNPFKRCPVAGAPECDGDLGRSGATASDPGYSRARTPIPANRRKSLVRSALGPTPLPVAEVKRDSVSHQISRDLDGSFCYPNAVRGR